MYLKNSCACGSVCVRFATEDDMMMMINSCNAILNNVYMQHQQSSSLLYFVLGVKCNAITSCMILVRAPYGKPSNKLNACYLKYVFSALMVVVIILFGIFLHYYCFVSWMFCRDDVKFKMVMVGMDFLVCVVLVHATMHFIIA